MGQDAADKAEISAGKTNGHSLQVQFQPPLYLQRRALVLSILKGQVIPCTSLLDVGTGQGELLTYLTPCDDDTPITKMVGLDPDAHQVNLALQNTRPNAAHTADLRWRALEISLYHGGVSDLAASMRHFDCITAIEVFEHLDSPDLSALAEKCLGCLQPRLFIVTTPNRDFNKVFERIEKDDRHRFYRPGIEYAMRHHDHRFEMSRAEFQAWANKQCISYDYTVRFASVGSVESAFSGQDSWREVYPETDLDDIFGCCTQVAIFERKTTERVMPENILDSHQSKLQHIVSHAYPYNADDGYPPSTETTLQLISAAEIYFRPIFDPEHNYTGLTETIEYVELEQFYETCYTIRRATRFKLAQFLDAVSAFFIQNVATIESWNIESQSESSALAGNEELEPTSRFKCLNFTVHQGLPCIAFVYDISSFAERQIQHESDDLRDCWDVAEEFVEPSMASWDQAEHTDSLEQIWT